MEINTDNNSVVLSEQAMFASPTVQRFNNKRKSAKATAQLVSHFKTTGSRTVEGKDSLFDPLHSDWKAITQAETALRKIHYHYTFALPSSGEGQSRGPRLLPNKAATHYLTAMHDAQADFDDAVKGYAENYDAHIDSSEDRLNGLFDRAKYPCRDDFVARHHASVSLTGLPTVDGIQAGEFTVAYQGAESERQDHAAAECTKQIADRVLTAVKALSVGLAKIDEPKSRFAESLFENLRELSDTIIPLCNIADDSRLNEIADDVNRMLKGDNEHKSVRHAMALPNAVKHNESVREAIAKDAKSIAAKASSML